jgi:UDP-N-acetylglucosamine 2-epimerase (non-hydrolysing)
VDRPLQKEKKIKVLLVFGTRPEAIKMAPVLRELHRRRDSFRAVLCITAQHREMLDQVLTLFGVKPDYDLNIMKPGQNLAYITTKAVLGLNEVIEKEKPDIVLVQGDTTTTFCGALAAFYHMVKVGHIEAGLRTDNKYAPYPEEINRRLTTQLTDYHFAPTKHACSVLRKEGVNENAVFVTGNTVIDAMLWAKEKVGEDVPSLPPGLKEVLAQRKVVLVTGHRRESFGKGFENICKAIRIVAENCGDTVFVYPVHLNPNVKEPVNRILGGHPRILLVEPLPYAAFAWLMSRSTIVLTDSGGIQEEAPSLGKPVLVMRETTERPEGVEAGNARLVGVRKEDIVDGLTDLLEHRDKREAMARISNPYGDGYASERIVNIIQRKLGGD